jgi:anti-sigma B factor antagonist
MKYAYEIDQEIIILQLVGNLMGDDKGPELLELANDLVNQGKLFCAIDISQIKYMSSSGIGVLITLLTKFRNKGGEVVLINPSEHVKKLLIITKLNAIFNIVDKREQAIEQLKTNKK